MRNPLTMQLKIIIISHTKKRITVRFFWRVIFHIKVSHLHSRLDQIDTSCKECDSSLHARHTCFHNTEASTMLKTDP